MHSKCHYKIFICPVILGELQSFRNCRGFGSFIFPKILDAISPITKVDFFLIPLSVTFLNPKILGFLFCTKNSLTWGVKCEKKKKKKSSRKLCMNGTVIQVIENSKQYLLLRTGIFQKTVVGCP